VRQDVDAPPKNRGSSAQASKRIAYGVDEGVITADEADWERTVHEMRSLIRAEDATEGPLAFAENRQPVWKAR
jgi:crotonobetainyl-CoA hydratase